MWPLTPKEVIYTGRQRPQDQVVTAATPQTRGGKKNTHNIVQTTKYQTCNDVHLIFCSNLSSISASVIPPSHTSLFPPKAPRFLLVFVQQLTS